MPDPREQAVRIKRAASKWTLIHPIFALGQLLAFFVSVGFLIAYFRGGASYHDVHVTVLIKIGLMVGAVITGSLWEHDVFGYWWFAPEFLAEDVMTLIVFIFQVSYLAMVWLHPDRMYAVIGILVVAYAVYAANVAQYIHKTQRAKSSLREPELRQAA